MGHWVRSLNSLGSENKDITPQVWPPQSILELGGSVVSGELVDLFESEDGAFCAEVHRAAVTAAAYADPARYATLEGAVRGYSLLDRRTVATARYGTCLSEKGL